MLAALKKILAHEELRKKISFTLLLLALCRIGAYIPVPGINQEVAILAFKQNLGAGAQNLFQLMDVFSGGAFAQMTVIALGVMPYISASIILQLVMAVVPSLQREVKENPESGKRKLGKWIRMATIGLAFMQSLLYARYALRLNAGTPGLIVPHLLDPQIASIPWLFYVTVIFTMTTGTFFLMWLGEQITEKGIGNGMSLIITLGIVSSLPTTLGSMIRQLNLDSQEPGQLTLSSLVVLSFVFVAIVFGTIMIIQGQRKIPLQYARRPSVGMEGVENENAYLPLKVNYAGVIPVIFASSLLMFPATLAQFLGTGSFLATMASFLSPGNWTYTLAYVLLIIFFTYFWTATQFHPEQIASDMKKNGAFIPSIRQGKPTQDFLEACMNRITFLGAIFLAALAILPTLVGKILHVDSNITYFFGGTSLLILVGVVLDTTKQIESHMLTKRYEGFMRKDKIRF